MMPLPSQLRGSVRPKNPVIDETALDADVVWCCGSRRFGLLQPGQTQEYRGEQIPCGAEIDERFYFAIQARRVGCGRGHLLFDKDFHGWEGFVCHDKAQASMPRPPLVFWKCLACGQSEHEATVHIHTQGREDFDEATEGDIEAERWPDAFDWFNMVIRCTGCRKKTAEWVSYETG